MNLNHATNKENGSTLSAAEWNSLAADVNELGAGGNSNVSSNVVIEDDTVTDPSAGVSIATAINNVGTAKVFELTKKKKGVRWKIEPTTQAMRGRRMICPMTPAKTGRGRWRMRRKS